MFVQMISMRVPMGQMNAFGKSIDDQYLGEVYHQAGFIRGYLLEQADDPDQARLVLVWESQAALETFHQSGRVDEIFKSLQEQYPGLTRQSQSYVLRTERA